MTTMAYTATVSSAGATEVARPAVLLPAAIPQIAVLAIEIPIKDLLLGLAKTLA